MNKCQRTKCNNETKTKYCSRSCSARVNNAKRPKRQPQGKCKTCSKPIPVSRFYCDKECRPSRNKRTTCKRCDGVICKGSNSLCQVHYNEYMSDYMLKRYYKRRAIVIKSLGGACFECGSDEELEIDHKDQHEKSFNLGKALAGWSQKRIDEEIKKCQLLCKECHRAKTRKDLADRFGQREHWEHGTISGYNYCRCDLCKKAKSESNKQYRSAKK